VTGRALAVSRLGLGKRAVALRDYGIVFSFLAIFIYLSIASPVFLSSQNLSNVLEQSAAVGIVAAGGTLVIIAGGFDLSVGAIFALCGVVAAMVTNAMGVPAGIAAALLVGTGIGIVNGLVTTVGRINPFITTLGTAIIIRGVTLSITGGFLVAVEEPLFTVIGRDSIFGIKYSVIILALFVLATGILLARTPLGRHMYSSGGNPEAARLAGISVTRTRTIAFAISGLSAAIAGVIITSRSANGQAAAGQGLEFAAIAAIVVGGTSIFGGEGAIWRTVLGVFLLALIGNGFNLLAVPPTYQQIFQGAIILAAVGIDVWARRKEGIG
jgi:ribose transport system permease protein